MAVSSQGVDGLDTSEAPPPRSLHGPQCLMTPGQVLHLWQYWGSRRFRLWPQQKLPAVLRSQVVNQQHPWSSWRHRQWLPKMLELALLHQGQMFQRWSPSTWPCGAEHLGHLRVFQRLHLWQLKMLELALAQLGLRLHQQWCLLLARSCLTWPSGAAHQWHWRASGRLRLWMLKMMELALELALELAQVHLGQMLHQHLSTLQMKSCPAQPS